MAVFRRRLHQRVQQGGTSGIGDGIDFAVGALFLRFRTDGNEPVFGQAVQRGIDGSETGFDEMLVAVVFKQLLDLVAGGIATAENPQTYGADVHKPRIRSMLVRYRSGLYMSKPLPFKGECAA